MDFGGIFIQNKLHSLLKMFSLFYIALKEIKLKKIGKGKIFWVLEKLLKLAVLSRISR